MTRTGIAALFSRTGAVCALTAAALGGTLAAPGFADRAEAASVSARALKIAASKAGSPFQYGATGPHRFDCSGLTLYSFKRAGKGLPRTAASQYNSTRHISASSRRPGDLVFFHSGRYVFHVGLYAGDGEIWHAPKTGEVVRRQKIWTSVVWYGRVR